MYESSKLFENNIFLILNFKKLETVDHFMLFSILCCYLFFRYSHLIVVLKFFSVYRLRVAEKRERKTRPYQFKLDETLIFVTTTIYHSDILRFTFYSLNLNDFSKFRYWIYLYPQNFKKYIYIFKESLKTIFLLKWDVF